jgi:hypothetical protein
MTTRWRPTAAKTLSLRAIARCVPQLSKLRCVGTAGPLSGRPVQLSMTEDIEWRSSIASHGALDFDLRSFPRDDLTLDSPRGTFTVTRPLATSFGPFDGAIGGVATGVRLAWRGGRGKSVHRFATCLPLPKDLRNRWDATGFLEETDSRTFLSNSVMRLDVGGVVVDCTHLRQAHHLLVDARQSPNLPDEATFTELGETIRRFLSYFLGLRLDTDAYHLVLADDGDAITTRWASGRRRAAAIFGYHPVPLDPVDRHRCHSVLGAGKVRGPALDAAVVGRLITELHRRPALVTPIEYLLRWHEAPVEMRGAFLSVALESLTSVIKAERKLKAPKPVDDATWKRVRAALRAVVESEVKPTPTGDARGPLLSRINDLNGPTNRAKLTQPFDVLGIALRDDEFEAIDKRNTLLHEGRILDEAQRQDPDAWREPYMIEMRLFTVVNKLLLRFLGYEGPVIDWGAMSINSPEHEYGYVG